MLRPGTRRDGRRDGPPHQAAQNGGLLHSWLEDGGPRTEPQGSAAPRQAPSGAYPQKLQLRAMRREAFADVKPQCVSCESLTAAALSRTQPDNVTEGRRDAVSKSVHVVSIESPVEPIERHRDDFVTPKYYHKIASDFGPFAPRAPFFTLSVRLASDRMRRNAMRTGWVPCYVFNGGGPRSEAKMHAKGSWGRQ